MASKGEDSVRFARLAAENLEGKSPLLRWIVPDYSKEFKEEQRAEQRAQHRDSDRAE